MDSLYFRGVSVNSTFRLQDLLMPIPRQVVSLPMVNKQEESMTTFFFDAGEGISRDIQQPDILYFVVSGRAEVVTDRTSHSLAAGSAILAPSNTPHSIDAAVALHVIQISVEARKNNDGGEREMSGQDYIKNIEKATVQQLKDLVAYQPDRVASLTLVQRDYFTVTLMAMSQGTGVGPHVCEGDAMVVALDGAGDVTIGDAHHTVCAGGCIVMPADISHAVRGTESNFKMMLIVSKPQE